MRLFILLIELDVVNSWVMDWVEDRRVLFLEYLLESNRLCKSIRKIEERKNDDKGCRKVKE